LLAILASALPKTIEEVGAIAGIVSFVVFLGLLGLYIARAIELRRLRKSMPFLANPTNGNGQPDKRSRRARRQAGL
jgi:hypothetical protein